MCGSVIAVEFGQFVLGFAEVAATFLPQHRMLD
jgi:hypothetical protein